jgi:hypothetical protein
MKRAVMMMAAAVLLTVPTLAGAENFLFDPRNPTDTLGQRQQREESQRSLQLQQDNRARDNLDSATRSRMDSERRTNELLSGDRGTRPVDRDAVRRQQQRSLDATQQEQNARDALERQTPPKLPGE